MGKINSAYSFMFPASAELVFIIEETKLFNYIIHDQVCVNLRFIGHMLLVCFTQLTDLIDVKSLIGVHFEHAHDQGS